MKSSSLFEHMDISMESLTLPPEVHEELSSSEKVRQNLNGGGKYGYLVVKVIILAVVASTISFSLSTVEDLNKDMGWLFNLIEVSSVLLSDQINVSFKTLDGKWPRRKRESNNTKQ